MSPVVAVSSPSTAYLLARATSDTVPTGPGDVKYVLAPGHFGPAGDRPIYGLRLNVERIAGAARATIPSGTTRVIVVPWDYDAACSPVPFTRSARWISAELRGVVRAELRDRRHWVNGEPTLDVFSPTTSVYAPDHAPVFAYGRAIPADSTLTLAEMLIVADVLPNTVAMARDVPAALQPFVTWARANPGVAARHPAREIASTLGYSLQNRQMATVRHPASGTWRFRLQFDDHAPLTVYGRTWRAPSSGQYAVPRGPPPDPFDMPPYDRYSLLMSVSADSAGLLSSCEARGIYPERESYFTVHARPADSASRERVYLGDIELSAFSRVFTEDSVVRVIDAATFENYSARAQRNAPSEELITGRVTVEANGTARLAQADVLGDGRRITITGERVSLVVVTCGR